MAKTLTLSVIIPAYNEENHLPACLDAIAKQTVAPDEVIVVDNNSTDKTAEIASSYDFVELIREPKQGLIAARNRGFKVARGDLIARIDADSILANNWTEHALKVFEDKNTNAITGPGKMFIDAHIPWLESFLWTKLYYLHTLSQMRFGVLWGANMVITNQLWSKIGRESAKKDSQVHEDQDLSILIKSHGYDIKYDKNLVISTDGRRFMYAPKSFEYFMRERRTIRRHRLLGTLAKARKNGSINFLLAWGIFAVMLFPAVFYSFSSGLYTLEKILGLRKSV